MKLPGPAKPKSKATKSANGGGDPQTASPLFSLPRELRDMIYEEAFRGHVQDVDHHPNESYPGILLACKQTHHETINLFYKRTTFECGTRRHGIDWFTHMPKKYRDQVVSLRYCVCFWPEDVIPLAAELGSIAAAEGMFRKWYKNDFIEGLRREGATVKEEVISIKFHK